MKELIDAVSNLENRTDRSREDNYGRLFEALGWYLDSRDQSAALILHREAKELHRLQATWELRDQFKDPFDEDDDEPEEGIDEDEEAHWYAPI